MRLFSILLSLTYGIFICHIEVNQVECFRVGSEKLKNLSKLKIERLFDSDALQSFYWLDEPLNAAALSKASGLNITQAETTFNSNEIDTNRKQNNLHKETMNQTESRSKLIRDTFVTVSAERDRSYTLTINLELNNPFKVIKMRYIRDKNQQNDAGNVVEDTVGSFSIRLPRSSLLVHLSQRISYEDCLGINHVQLATNGPIDISCDSCATKELENLDKILLKRASQLDAELDSLLSEKLLLGLRTLLNHQRLDFDIFLSQD